MAVGLFCGQEKLLTCEALSFPSLRLLARYQSLKAFKRYFDCISCILVINPYYRGIIFQLHVHVYHCLI